MHYYRLGSWKVRSSLSLPWLSAGVEMGAAPDILIECGSFPDPDETLLAHTVMVDVYPSSAVISIPGLVRFKVENGSRIIVDLAPGVDSIEIQPFLLGTGLAMLGYQRGLVPLRGCALGKGNNALTILGRSASGKSTLAAALLSQGHRLISDDVVLVDPESASVVPTFPVLRLWRDSALILGVAIEKLPRVRGAIEKFALSTQNEFQDQSCSLTTIILLKNDESMVDPEMSRVKRTEALLRLYPKRYSPRLDRLPGNAARNFKAFSKLASQAAVYSLTRTHELARVNELADLIEASKDS